MKKGLLVVGAILLIAWGAAWAVDTYTDYDMGTTANNPNGMRKIKDGTFPLPLTGLSRSMPGDSACTSATFDISEFSRFTSCWDLDSNIGLTNEDGDKCSTYVGVYFQVSQDASAWWTFDSCYDTTGGTYSLAQKCKVWTTDPACPYGRFIFAGQNRIRLAAGAGAESRQSDSICIDHATHTFQQ